jgi:RNA polymerase sigma-70 factor (ECF subfamily)
VVVDVELVERAKHGDQAAFETLVRAAVGRLSTVARLMVTDTDVADDAVQETIVQSWRDLRGLRDPARFDAWTHRILVRNVIREARRERRHRVTAIEADDIVARTTGWSSDVDDRDEIERGLRRISPDRRIVLVLHHYLGLDGPAAADALGIPPATFRSRLRRATEAMRSELEADARVDRRLRPESAR